MTHGSDLSRGKPRLLGSGLAISMCAKKEKIRDDRVTIKVDKVLWNMILQELRKHPEWGLKSVSGFVRRAIANELKETRCSGEKKVIEILLRPRPSRGNIRGRGP